MLGLLTHTPPHPDCQFQISRLAQVSEEKFDWERSATTRQLNKVASYAVHNAAALPISKLDLKTLHIVGIGSSSLANNSDLSTQLGLVIFLRGATGSFVPIDFLSYKSRRVVRSPMGGEVIGVSNFVRPSCGGIAAHAVSHCLSV